MAGPIWKGSQGPVITREDARYDAALQLYFKTTTWHGSRLAISGLEPSVQEQDLDYTVFNDGPVYELTTDIPQNDPDDQSVDQYEIFSESTQISIWTDSGVFDEIERYEILRGTERPYKAQAEEYAEDGRAYDEQLNDGVLFPLFPDVIKHVRGGVDTFDVDLIVLRRFRRVSRQFAQGGTGKINLKFSQIIYTTAQLQLPTDIAFTIPDPPTEPDPFSDQFRWGWRMRSQNSEYIGQWVEQRYELLFGPHSLLRNSDSAGNLAW